MSVLCSQLVFTTRQEVAKKSVAASLTFSTFLFVCFPKSFWSLLTNMDTLFNYFSSCEELLRFLCVLHCGIRTTSSISMHAVWFKCAKFCNFSSTIRTQNLLRISICADCILGVFAHETKALITVSWVPSMIRPPSAGSPRQIIVWVTVYVYM